MLLAGDLNPCAILANLCASAKCYGLLICWPFYLLGTVVSSGTDVSPWRRLAQGGIHAY